MAFSTNGSTRDWQKTAQTLTWNGLTREIMSCARQPHKSAAVKDRQVPGKFDVASCLVGLAIVITSEPGKLLVSEHAIRPLRRRLVNAKIAFLQVL
jgi:hypothetical protein